MKWFTRFLDLVATTGLALAGLSTGGAIPPKVGLIGGAVGTVAAKLAASPNWMPTVPPKETPTP